MIRWFCVDVLTKRLRNGRFYGQSRQTFATSSCLIFISFSWFYARFYAFAIINAMAVKGTKYCEKSFCFQESMEGTSTDKSVKILNLGILFILKFICALELHFYTIPLCLFPSVSFANFISVSPFVTTICQI